MWGQQSTTMLKRLGLLGVIIASLIAPGYLLAEEQGPGSDQAETQVLSQSELEELVGPIALYVDDLVAIVLTASVYPVQVVQAERFLAARKDDPDLEPDPEWDEAVVALLNYPDVLQMMSEQLEWTAALGEAFAYQQEDVMAAIQDFRQQAWSAGNLQSDDRTIVRENTGDIELVPAEREVVYVPYYEPTRVIVYSEAPVIHYYPTRYPLYYYPYSSGHVFDIGFFFGVRTAFLIGWHSHNIHVYPHDYVHHPYYGRRYSSRYYARHYVGFSSRYDRYTDHVWRPTHHRYSRSRAWSAHRHGSTDHRARKTTRDSRTYIQPSPAREHGVGRDRHDVRPLDARSFSNRRRTPRSDRPAEVHREQASEGNASGVARSRKPRETGNEVSRVARPHSANGVARGPVVKAPAETAQPRVKAVREATDVAAEDVKAATPASRKEARDKHRARKHRRNREEASERR